MRLPKAFHFLRPGWWGVHVAAIAAVAALGYHLGADQGGHHGHAPAATGPGNVVQQEMRALEAALSAVPGHFASGNLAAIEHALHGVHLARERTEAALKSGTYRPPRNAGEVAQLESLDRAFHEELEGLAKAAARGEVQQASEALGRVVGSCHGCHARFR